MVYWELRKPCTLPSHFRFSASPRDTSWRPRRSKARNGRLSSYKIQLAHTLARFHNGSMFCFCSKRTRRSSILTVCIMCRFPTTPNTCSKPIPSGPAGLAKLLQGLVGLGISEHLGTTAAEFDGCNSLYLVVSVFDNI